MPVLDVLQLYKTYPIHEGFLRKKRGSVDAVADVSFSVEERQILGVIGESGAGKSTLARLVMCLTRPTSGKVVIDGKEVSNLCHKELLPLRKNFQMVFQNPLETFNRRKTIANAFFEVFSLHHLVSSEEEAVACAYELFRKVGLDPGLFWRYPHEVSIGQLARICLAKALSTSPRLLVLDECISALDISIKAHIMNLLLELSCTASMSYLFISHDLPYVYHLADSVLVMKEGRVVEAGAVEAVFQSPQHPYTKSLLANTNGANTT
jgi:ABC-type oligopeptide transport system ATPase subunit